MTGRNEDEARVRSLLPANRDSKTVALWVSDRRTLIPALFDLARRADEPGLFREMVAACDVVLEGVGRDADLQERAWVEGERANAMRRAAQGADDQAGLEGAITAFDRALSVQQLGPSPAAYALTLSRRASATSTLGALRADAALLRQAAAQFDEAIATPGFEALAWDYGAARLNRGNALSRLFDVTGEPTWLKVAAEGYARAYDRDREPADWADAQMRRARDLRRFRRIDGRRRGAA
jgi:hypothetical protein